MASAVSAVVAAAVSRAAADWKDPEAETPLLCLILGVPGTPAAASKPFEHLVIHIVWTDASSFKPVL